MDLIHTGGLRSALAASWAKSGLRTMGEDLSEHWDLIAASLGRVRRPHWPLPPLIATVAGPVGEAGAGAIADIHGDGSRYGDDGLRDNQHL